MVEVVQAIVRVKGGKVVGLPDKDFSFTGERKVVFNAAVNFASGIAWALANNKHGLALYTPMVQAYDGYKWWDEREFDMRVLTGDDKLVCTPDDLV